jgi:hypothetical protein
MGPTFLSTKQLELAQVVGVRTDMESRIIAGGSGSTTIVFDERKDSRWPVFIHIQNLHASEKLYVSEDLRDANGIPVCSAALFTAILAPGQNTDDGMGAGMEWQKNRPSCISIFGTNNYRALIAIRYVDEN